MFAKLAAIILALGILGCTLLALRQQRLQAAHELAEAQLRIRRSDEQLWLLRTQIARRLNPENIRDMAADAGPLRPVASPLESGASNRASPKPEGTHADGAPSDKPRPSMAIPRERLAHDSRAAHSEPR